MKVVSKKYLIGKTIKTILYNRDKNRLIFLLDDGSEIMIKTPRYNRYDIEVTQDNLFYKNRTKIDYREITDVYIKDIAYDGTSAGISYLLIIDDDANTYRTHCYVNELRIVKNEFYNYTLYILNKAERMKRKQEKVDKIKSIFVKNNYDKI